MLLFYRSVTEINNCEIQLTAEMVAIYNIIRDDHPSAWAEN